LGLTELIFKAKYSFPDPEWTNVSQEGLILIQRKSHFFTAKSFVSGLLMLDPTLRMTAKQALKDEWIVKYGAEDSPSPVTPVKTRQKVEKPLIYNPAKLRGYLPKHQESATSLIYARSDSECSS
jgi:hypothetical protein